MKALHGAIREGMIQSCHDLSEGGLAVASAEMALAGLLGTSIDIGKVISDVSTAPGSLDTLLLFSETPSRFLVEIAPAEEDRFEEYMRSEGVHDFACIGEVTDTSRLIVQHEKKTLIDLPIASLQTAWKGDGKKA
jgi:phosphoribosylformylglycinamidine synthase